MKRIKFFIFIFLFVTSVYGGANPHLTGAFFQLDGSYDAWSQSTWDSKLQDLKDIGMDTIIIQFSAYDNYSYYDSNLSYITVKYINILPRLMQAADNKGMHVYVATYYQNGWFSRSEDDDYISTNATRNTNVIDDLVDNFGITSYNSFAGWYIPYEIDGLHNMTNSAKTKLINFFNKIADYCKVKTPSKLVTTSPFFNEDLITPADYGAYLNDLLSGIPNLDIVMLQDGIGVDHLSFSNAGLYFDAVKNACDINNRILWINCENFTTNDMPAPIDRLKEQLLLARPYSKKLVTFEYFYYMGKDDVQGKGSTTLYTNYKKYYQSICTDTNPPLYTVLTPYLNDSTKLLLTFNERINMVKADQITNYTINFTMHPSCVEVDHKFMTNIILTFSIDISSGYSLDVKNIEDLYGNGYNTNVSTNLQPSNINKEINDYGVYPSPCSMSANDKILFYFGKSDIKISIYDFYANKIIDIITDSSGIAEWYFQDDKGNKVESGIYFYFIQYNRKKGTIVLMD